MINLITILAAFFGGLLGRALAPDNRYHRMLAFIVLVCISTGLLHIPLLLDMLRFGFPALAWGTLTEWCASRYDVFLLAGLLTGAGWLCSYCIQNIFED